MSLKEEVKDILDSFSNDIQVRYFYGEGVVESEQEFYKRYDYSDELRMLDSFKEKGLIVEFIEQVGGEEQGREYYSIYKFSKDEESVYVKFDGWYQSYLGAEYEGWFFVTPKEKVVTVYV